MKNLIWIVLTVILSQVCKGEVYFTASEMKNLVLFERWLASEFLPYFDRETRRINRIEKFVNQLKETHEPLKRAPKHTIMSHPTHSYKVLSRMAREWSNIDWMFTSKESNENLNNLKRLSHNILGFKNGLELRGTMNSIFRLQETYKLDVKDMVNGMRQPAHRLSFENMYEVAMFANHFWAFPQAVAWSKYIVKQFGTEVDVSLGIAMLSDVYDILSWASYKIRDIPQAIEACKISIKFNATQKRRENLIWFEEFKRTKKIPSDTFDINEDLTGRNKTLQSKRCRQEETLNPSYAATLFCKYYSPHARFILKPLKQEQIYHEPKIDKYHDILSEFEMEYIKQKARKKLQSAQVYDMNNGKLTVAEYRISKNAWLYPKKDKVVAKVVKRVGDLANMDVRYTEPLQVANYGIGGNYEAHFDYARPPHNSSIYGAYGNGDRIATMLFYLETVERGGDTTFVNIGPGVSVKAVRGTGVFWHNLKKNGKGNELTMHAACPVLLGEKWISNLWLHEHGQEFRHPCSLNKDE